MEACLNCEKLYKIAEMGDGKERGGLEKSYIPNKPKAQNVCSFV